MTGPEHEPVVEDAAPGPTAADEVAAAHRAADDLLRDAALGDAALRGDVSEEAPGEAAPAGPGGPQPSGADDPMSVLTRERDEYLDMVRRVQAEFENYKKRIIRQQTEHLERAAESLVVKLLPALDTIDLARSHHDPDSEAGTALAQVAAAWHDALAKEGLEKIDPLGQAFDPNEAEAVMHEPADGPGAAHEVVEVLRPGYRWRGRVVRPAMVKVKG